ncbi:MAG: TOPRIM nucleotidyl transferase/hydrolase domain-containing protein [Ferrimicrobium sp.]
MSLIQVCYATNSPYFVEARRFARVCRLTRTVGEHPVVTVHSSSLQRVKAALATIVKPTTVDRRLDGTISNQLSIALFATRVLLVEGTTETAVFYGIGDREAVGALEAQGIAIVAVGGKANLPLAHAILTSLGIPTYALFDGFDGDFGFGERARAINKSQEKINAERATHITGNRNLLRYFRLPEVDFPEERMSDTVAVLSDHPEGFLETNWPEWIAACEKLENEATMSLNTNQAAYRTVTLESKGIVPRVLGEIINYVGG